MTDDWGTVEDGMGGVWSKCGPDCTLEVVRPGKVQCIDLIEALSGVTEAACDRVEMATVVELRPRQDQVGTGNVTCECGDQWWETAVVVQQDYVTPRLDGGPGLSFVGYSLPLRCKSCGAVWHP